MATQVLTGSWSHLALVLGPRPPAGARCNAGLERSHPETPAPGQGMGTKAPSFLCPAPPRCQILSQEDSRLHCSENERLYCAPSPGHWSSLWLWSLC